MTTRTVGSALDKPRKTQKCRISNQSGSNQYVAHQHNGKEQGDTGTTSADIFSGGFQRIAAAYGN
ncbi:hypothetical protein ACE10Z_14820 [Bradyrhizobium sp. Pha-3]|uniref:hypothetical protein n=1 Tax=Bradyrhizobium sp. Pha-3 TaxID=208375 RepID=UPI0035D3E9E4